MPAIFIPISQPLSQPPRQIECIIQNGKKYCETSDITSYELGMIILITVIICGYVIYCVTKFWDDGKKLAISLATPLIILALILLFK